VIQPLAPELLAILVCPVPECHGRLEQRGPDLACLGCGLQYPIEEHWPVLIPEEARPTPGVLSETSDTRG